MMEEIIKGIAAGADAATIAIAFGFYKLSTRLTVVETALKFIKENIASLKAEK
jgi:hypothetical protein